MDFDRIINRRGTDSLRWDLYPNDVLPLWVADMDFESPASVMRALHERIDHGIFGYTLTPSGLTEILRNRLQTLYNWQVTDENIGFVPGIVTGFNLALRAVCKPGDAVIIMTPAYPPFIEGPKNGNFKLVECPMLVDADNQYSIDFDHFEALIVENNVKAYIHCDPHNPTGRIFTHEELEKLAAILLRHNVFVCSDEIHCDILYEGKKHIPYASLSKETADNTITFIAPSKTYNIAGLHASVSIIQNKDLAAKYQAARAGIVGAPGLLAMVAAKAAYSEGDEWLKEILVYLQKNRDWLAKEIPARCPGLKVTVPEATFLMWIDCRGMGVENPSKAFQEKGKLALNDGKFFGDQYAQFVRLNFGTPLANLRKAVDAIEATLKTL